MDLKELLKKFYDAGIMAEATLEEKYSFEQTLADNSQALQLLQTGVKRCFSDDHIGVIARNIAKDSNEITLGEVIRFFEGMIAMISCVSVSSYESCSQEGKCHFRRVFLNIRNLTAQILDKTTIASCLAQTPITKEDVYKEEFIGGLGI